jgi:predicted RNA methylase
MDIVEKIGSFETLEIQRLKSQDKLDSLKKHEERNKLGQFATPSFLAYEILEFAKTLLDPSKNIIFLDPAFGTGSFFSALLRLFPMTQISAASGFEIDPHYGQEALTLWSKTPLKLSIVDFTKLSPPESEEQKANLIICNPPYVRHHHLASDEKVRLQNIVKHKTGIRLNGLAGLYCYFLLLSDGWMAKNALAGWLIPSEFMDVNYGAQIKFYLLNKVTLIRIHRFDPNHVQFQDALVSSAIVWFKKERPPINHEVEFTYGGTLTKPYITSSISSKVLGKAAKWTNLLANSNYKQGNENVQGDTPLKFSDIFEIKRGIATGANSYFILGSEQLSRRNLPFEFFIPILPSPRYLKIDEIHADEKGNPKIDPQLYLLDCNLGEEEIRHKYPTLWNYLEVGISQGIHERYLCRHRLPWYSQEYRSASPLLCTYMGRSVSTFGKPFRFILNHSKAIAANVYLMLYPRPHLALAFKEEPSLLETIWHELNKIPVEALINEGRVYGGGLHKLEPNELGNANIDFLKSILPISCKNRGKQIALF